MTKNKNMKIIKSINKPIKKRRSKIRFNYITIVLVLCTLITVMFGLISITS